MCECGGRARRAIASVAKLHGCDKTVVHREYVDNFAVRKNLPLNALNELAHLYADDASVLLGNGERFDMRIELTPLSSPIDADLFFSHNSAALRSLEPTHVFCHQCQCTFDVPLVECGIRLLNQGPVICHATSYKSSLRDRSNSPKVYPQKKIRAVHYFRNDTNFSMCLANSSGSSIGIRCPLRGMISNRAFAIRATTSRLCCSIESSWSSSPAKTRVGTSILATSDEMSSRIEDVGYARVAARVPDILSSTICSTISGGGIRALRKRIVWSTFSRLSYACIWVSRISSGNRRGVGGAGATSTRPRSPSGRRDAASCAILPPRECPTSTNSLTPTSRTSANTSSARSFSA